MAGKFEFLPDKIQKNILLTVENFDSRCCGGNACVLKDCGEKSRIFGVSKHNNFFGIRGRELGDNAETSNCLE